MKIVFLDGYTENPGDLSYDVYKEFGELTVYDRTPADKVAERIGDAEIVFTNKTPITEATMQACPRMFYIGVQATGYNIVDIEAARRHGVCVTNIPTYGTFSVAQLTFAHLLEICHRVGHHSSEVKKGRWITNPDWCFWDGRLIELADKTLGIIGFGRIGQRVGQIAQAFGMNVLAFDQYQNPDLENEHCHYADLDTLFEKADVITLHCPLTPENTGIINKENIAKMKDGVILLNTSRGPLVNEADLAEALASGKVAAAGLDVVCKEPMDPANPLLNAPNCFLTPHIAWAPFESRKRLADICEDNLRAFLAGKPVNVVS